MSITMTCFLKVFGGLTASLTSVLLSVCNCKSAGLDALSHSMGQKIPPSQEIYISSTNITAKLYNLSLRTIGPIIFKIKNHELSTKFYSHVCHRISLCPLKYTNLSICLQEN